MGFTSDAHGKPHWRGTKCVSRSRQGQALEPGSLRLTWSASRKHRCQVEPPPAGSLRSGSSQVILNVPRKPEPLPQHQACTPAGQPKLGMPDASTAGLKWRCCCKLLLSLPQARGCGFRTGQARNAAPGWEVWWEGRAELRSHALKGKGLGGAANRTLEPPDPTHSRPTREAASS